MGKDVKKMSNAELEQPLLPNLLMHLSILPRFSKKNFLGSRRNVNERSTFFFLSTKTVLLSFLLQAYILLKIA